MKKILLFFLILLFLSISSAHAFVHSQSHFHDDHQSIQNLHLTVDAHEHHHGEEGYSHVDNLFFRSSQCVKAFLSSFKLDLDQFNRKYYCPKPSAPYFLKEFTYLFQKTPTTYRNIPLRI